MTTFQNSWYFDCTSCPGSYLSILKWKERFPAQLVHWVGQHWAMVKIWWAVPNLVDWSLSVGSGQERGCYRIKSHVKQQEIVWMAMVVAPKFGKIHVLGWRRRGHREMQRDQIQVSFSRPKLESIVETWIICFMSQRLNRSITIEPSCFGNILCSFLVQLQQSWTRIAKNSGYSERDS